MKTRILSAVLLLPLLAVLYFGGMALWIACLLIALLGVREFYQGYEKIGIKPTHWVGFLSAVSLYGIGLTHGDLSLGMPWLVGIVTISLLTLFSMERRQLQDAMATVLGAVYVVLFSYHMVLIDHTEAKNLIWLVILAAFGTDTFAYFTGFLIGKHKLCPNISPKKTVEGAIGGVAGSILLCTIFGFFFAQPYLLHTAIIGVVGSVAGQLGDLTASVFKRKMGIKDYGTLIPGHGGILDRFDSVLFTAPFVYYYITLVIY